jgi:Protein of unknown function (DUF3575).
MKKLFILCVLFNISIAVIAQNERSIYYNPTVALKTNLLYWATTTPNLGLEIGLSKKITLDISGNYNPWSFSDNKKVKHWLVQPELRYWTCERFNGHFFGLHGHYAQFNFSCIKPLGMKGHRYEGDLYGAGLSYGYHWILNKRWSVEATIGVGWAHVDYDKYSCNECSAKIKSDNKNYFGPTKVGINLIYVIK